MHLMLNRPQTADEQIMEISKAGIRLIKRHEGLRLEAYDDPVGLPTIGYGHLIIFPQEEWMTRACLTPEQAEKLLMKDIAIFEAAIKRNINAPLQQNQFDALVSFTFNVGAQNLHRSTLRRRVNQQRHDDAAKEFERWVYAGRPKKKLPGLVKRRAEEAALYRGELVI